MRAAVGPDTFDAMQDAILATAAEGAMESLPLECLEQENVIVVSIALMSSQAGGLSVETRSCLVSLLLEQPELFDAGAGGVLEVIGCMTDDEAAAFAGGSDGNGAPKPSDLECVAQQPGGKDALEAMMSGNPSGLTQEQSAALGACGIDSGGVSFPDVQVMEATVGPELIDCVGVAPMKCLEVDGQTVLRKHRGVHPRGGLHLQVEDRAIRRLPGQERPAVGYVQVQVPAVGGDKQGCPMSGTAHSRSRPPALRVATLDPRNGGRQAQDMEKTAPGRGV